MIPLHGTAVLRGTTIALMDARGDRVEHGMWSINRVLLQEYKGCAIWQYNESTTASGTGLPKDP